MSELKLTKKQASVLRAFLEVHDEPFVRFDEAKGALELAAPIEKGEQQLVLQGDGRISVTITQSDPSLYDRWTFKEGEGGWRHSGVGGFKFPPPYVKY